MLVSDKFSIEQFTRLGLVLADIPAGLLLEVLELREARMLFRIGYLEESLRLSVTFHPLVFNRL